MRIFNYWPLYMAYKQLFPTGKRGSFFTWMAILGVMLGVMVLLIVQCVMEGFGQAICSRVVEANGDIRIEAGSPFRLDNDFLQSIEALPGVAAAAPYAHGMVMAQFGNRPAFAYVKGMDVDREKNVVPLERYLQEGDLQGLDDEGVWVSAQLARSLGVWVGDSLSLFSPLMLDRLSEEEVLLPEELEVKGIFRTGWNQIDAKTLLVNLPTMQRLYGMENQFHGISLRLKDPRQEGVVLQSLAKMLPFPLRAFPVLAMNEDLLFVLRLEKTVLFFIILFVILVASFSIASSLMTTAVRKTREIGLLRAMGGSKWQVAGIFCFQGFFIGFVGTALGTMAALLALAFRNPLVQLFAQWTQSEAVLVQFYQFSEIPVAYEFADFAVILPTAVLIATLAGLFPAWRAAHLLPAHALRSEG